MPSGRGLGCQPARSGSDLRAHGRQVVSVVVDQLLGLQPQVAQVRWTGVVQVVARDVQIWLPVDAGRAATRDTAKIAKPEELGERLAFEAWLPLRDPYGTLRPKCTVIAHSPSNREAARGPQRHF